MNYKKLVVMLCIGSHLLVTNSAAMAGWNPFKKYKKAIQKITKLVPIPPVSIPGLRLSPGTLSSLGTEISEIEKDLERLFPKVLNLNDAELMAQLAHIYTVLARNNSLDLLRFWEPDWLEKVESRVSPVMAETGLTLFTAFRRFEEEISREFTKKDSWIWAFARRANSMAEEISDELIKPMASSFAALGSPGSVTSDATELAELDTTSGALAAQWDVDEKIQTAQSDFIADFNDEQFNQADADSNFLKVGLSPNPMPSEAELDDDDIFDEDCGYLPIPVRFGALFTFIPLDRKVPKSCGGWKAKRGHQEFILASQVKELLNASEDDYLENYVGYSSYFKQPYGVAFDARWVNAVELKAEGVTVATVTFTPHVRIPLAWSAPAPSPRTLSTGSGNNLIKNMAHDRMLISPEFELAFHVGDLKSPLLSALVTNLEFPIAVKDLKNSPKSVLREMIVKVSYDRGIRWGFLGTKAASDVLKGIRLFLNLATRADGAVAPFLYLGPTMAEAAAAAPALAPAAAMAIEKMLALLAVLSSAEAGIGGFAFGDDEEARTAFLTASMPFVMGLAGSLARSAGVAVFKGSLRGATAGASITDISLIKIQLVFGFLNANFVAGLLNREPTPADAGFELVRPGTPDYVSFGVALLPQVTQTLFLLDFGWYKTGLQLWGPYGIYTPQVASPRTVAGQVYLKNGSDQFEPLLLK